jgi:predicted permease
MLKDLRQAARMLLRSKGWTAVVLVSLALGIGANTALFTAVNGLLIRTIPVARPDALVRLRWSGQNDMVRSSSDYGFSATTAAGKNVRTTFSYAVYQALRANNQTLTDLLACAPQGNLNVIVDGKAELGSAILVSGNYFQVLGVSPIAGRTIAPDDDRVAAAPVAVISRGYWARRFGLDPNVVGKVVTMNNVRVTIVGVTAAEFTGIQNLDSSARDITLPLAWDEQTAQPKQPSNLSQPTSWWLQVMGRLKPGATIDQVHANFESVFQNTARDGWTSYLATITPEQRALSRNQNRTIVPSLEVDSGRRGIYDLDRNTTRSAAILSVVVALVLLIVCANVANLLLSRAASRHKEITVRLSMGATRSRLVRQLLTESVLISTIGGLLGLLAGYWSRQLLPFGQNAPIDWRVVSFVAGLSVLTGLLFGLVPALRATRVDLSSAMKETSRSVSRTRTLLGKSLLVVQVALSLVLLIGAGLFLRTLWNLREVDVGFNTENLVLFTVNPALNGYDAGRIGALYADIHQALRGVPGVRSTSQSASALLAGNTSTTDIWVQGRPAESPHGLEMWVMTVSPEFFGTTGIPLLRGRSFDARDVAPKAPRVVLINETAARRYFPGEDPIGRRFGGSPEQTGETEIIGIIRDTKYSSVRDAAPPTAYSPYPRETTRSATFEVRTSGDPTAVLPGIRDAVRRIDPNLPLIRVTTQAEQVEGRFNQERLFATSYALFGALALLLASIGLFGLMSYSVARRTNEIGIRMALGAQRLQVVGMVLGESLLMVAIGVGVGLAAAMAAGRLVATLLFGLTPSDPLTVAVAVATMVIVSLVAGYLPARRASNVDPLIALRYE